MSPVANSRCRRSSNSRIVRIVRYASSTWSLVTSPVGGATADMALSSVSSSGPSLSRRGRREGWICRGPHHGVDVDGQRAGREPHGDRLAVAALDLALAVEGDCPGVAGHLDL